MSCFEEALFMYLVILIVKLCSGANQQHHPVSLLAITSVVIHHFECQCVIKKARYDFERARRSHEGFACFRYLLLGKEYYEEFAR